MKKDGYKYEATNRPTDKGKILRYLSSPHRFGVDLRWLSAFTCRTIFFVHQIWTMRHSLSGKPITFFFNQKTYIHCPANRHSLSSKQKSSNIYSKTRNVDICDTKWYKMKQIKQMIQNDVSVYFTVKPSSERFQGRSVSSCSFIPFYVCFEYIDGFKKTTKSRKDSLICFLIKSYCIFFCALSSAHFLLRSE